METLIQIFMFMFGAIIGSFLNVCIYRLPKNQSIIFPASHCTTCNRGLFWQDNIPIISYISLRGKCRFCNAKISPRYLIVEFLTATLLLLLYVIFGFSAKFFAYAVFTGGLIVATFVDFEIQEIPDQISLGGIVVGLISAAIFPSIFDTASRLSSVLNSFFGVIAGAAVIYIMKILGTAAFKNRVKA
ncbi:MAG: prepilin peptidase, partial [Candidatus Omnitrophota bacterium]